MTAPSPARRKTEGGGDSVDRRGTSILQCGTGGPGLAGVLGRFPNALAIYQLAAHDFRAQAAHDFRNVFLKSCRDLARALPMPLGKASVLILGCGYTYPDVALYAS